VTERKPYEHILRPINKLLYPRIPLSNVLHEAKSGLDEDTEILAQRALNAVPRKAHIFRGEKRRPLQGYERFQ